LELGLKKGENWDKLVITVNKSGEGGREAPNGKMIQKGSFENGGGFVGKRANMYWGCEFEKREGDDGAPQSG